MEISDEFLTDMGSDRRKAVISSKWIKFPL